MTERTQRLLRWLAVFAVIAFCLRTFSDNEADVDLWGNVGFVTSLPGTPGFLRANTYAFTEPDHPWINHEWLSEYVYHEAYSAFGNPGLLTVKVLLGFLLLACLSAALRRGCPGGALRLLLLLLAVSTIGYGFSTRPHLFTYVLYAAWLLLLQRKRDSALVLFVACPLSTVAWVNLHGAFFIGPLLLLVLAAGAAWDAAVGRSGRPGWIPAARLAAAAGVCVAASLVNPYGPATWDFIVRTAAIPRPYLSEWAPFNPARHLGDHADFVALAILVCAATLTGLRRRRTDTGRTLVLLVSLAAALLMRRNIPLFAITAAMLAAPDLHALAGPRVRDLSDRVPPAARAAFLALLACVSCWFTVAVRKQHPAQIEVEPHRFPIQAVAFMQANHVSGNALVFFDWAEYCIWHLYPSCRVFMDGRFASAYSPRTIEDYFDFLYRGPRETVALTGYPTDIVLLHRENPAHAVMRLAKDWALVFESRTAVLFVARNVHRDLLQRIETGKAVIPDVEHRTVFP